MDSEIIVNKEKLENSPLEINYLGDRSLRQSATVSYTHLRAHETS